MHEVMYFIHYQALKKGHPTLTSLERTNIALNFKWLEFPLNYLVRQCIRIFEIKK